jgi:isoquinoline 1-oxidoreductase alpha subunit
MHTLTVNGAPVSSAAEPSTPLLWVLRDQLGLYGTHYGCGAGLCGACTVHMDGKAVRSCATPLAEAAGRSVTTIEALDRHPAGPALQAAWQQHCVPQCGFCQSGQLMQAADLLQRNPQPTPAQVVEAMEGNLCRCGTYHRIRAAIGTAAKKLAGEAV